MILDPGEHRLYTDALRPPPGYAFDRGLATTFTLDLTTLLTVPLHLTLFSREEDTERLMDDGVGLLEALRRTAERINVYCQQGRIGAPVRGSVLFSLLEPVVLEARAPGGGFFHPKLWVIRYVDEDGAPLLRLLIPTRNLTRDRSWDLLLTLEGTPRGRRRKASLGLADLISRLPDLTTPGSKAPDRDLSELLADEVARTVWEPPEPFEDVRLHALGLERRPWRPPPSHQLLVLSPYVTGGALRTLGETTDRHVALVSRVEELSRLESGALAGIEQVHHLDPMASPDDTEEATDLLGVLTGFHAKAYVLKKGWHTHVFVGSANATGAALEGHNLEVLAELIGRASQVGVPDNLLDESGLYRILTPFVPPEEPEIDEKKEIQAHLDRARQRLIDAGLSLRCEERDGVWTLVLESKRPLPTAEDLSDIASIRAWPVTLHSDAGRDLFLAEEGEEIDFPCAIASLTAFLGFHVRAKGSELELRFALNLPVVGMPDERYAAIVRTILNNRDRFIQYLLLLLATGEDGWPAAADGNGAGWDFRARGSHDEVPLLEEMVRALCRDPGRLVTVRSIIQRLLQDEGADDVMPEEFLGLWNVVKAELEEMRK